MSPASRSSNKLTTTTPSSSSSSSSKSSSTPPASSCRSSSGLTSPMADVADPDDLRGLAATLSSHTESYLAALAAEGLPAPSLAAGTQDPWPQTQAGQAARLGVIAAAERILALAKGSAELWNVSRQSLSNAALQTILDLRIPTLIPLDAPRTAAQLAALTGAAPTLIVRLMRAATAAFIFTEVAPATYAHNARSQKMLDAEVHALLALGGTVMLRSAAALPEFLRATGYANPEEPAVSAFGRAYGTDLPLYDYAFRHDERLRNDIVAGMAATEKLYGLGQKVEDVYPFEKLAEHGGVVVDVGGGKGQIALSIAASRPAAALTYVVQDRPASVQAGEAACPAALAAKFTWQAHDFFTAQPVRGAAAYFMRHIMHNYSDTYCRRIVAHLVAAMVPGRSRLLIVDKLVPTMGCPRDVATMDWIMAIMSAQERSLPEFEALFRSVDARLVVERVWGDGETKVVEAVLRDEPVASSR